MAEAQIENNDPEHNLRHTLVYQDLREWIAEADRLGELRDVKGASWERDIGLACTVVKYDEDAPVLLFDEIPGVIIPKKTIKVFKLYIMYKDAIRENPIIL